MTGYLINAGYSPAANTTVTIGSPVNTVNANAATRIAIISGEPERATMADVALAALRDAGG